MATTLSYNQAHNNHEIKIVSTIVGEYFPNNGRFWILIYMSVEIAVWLFHTGKQRTLIILKNAINIMSKAMYH